MHFCDVGADPLFREAPTGDEVHNSPFELACLLCAAPILELFLQNRAVSDAVIEPRLMTTSADVMIRPLFQVTCDIERWARLAYHGKEFEGQLRETVGLLTSHGASPDAVLEVGDMKMAAPFVIAYHQANWEVMESGFHFGFQNHINSAFGSASSSGSPLFLAITHRDRQMFQLHVDNGADIHALDMYGMNPLQRAAKETDDVYFTESLLKAGCSVEPADPTQPSAFYIAVHAGNFRVAKFLFDRGADRDRVLTMGPFSKGILCDMLFKHTHSSARRVKFLLGLHDRDGSDGFLVARIGEHTISAYHYAVPPIGENPDDAEITRIMVLLLLEKYGEPRHVNSTGGPHKDTVIGVATEVGNHKVVKALLEMGADPYIPDEYGRTALNKLYWRYCYPATTDAFDDVDLEDRNLVARPLAFFNGNTSELLSLLTSYNAVPKVFSFPAWFAHGSGYRSVDWVIERLREKRSPEGMRRAAETMESGRPVWGGLPITIPERPMQLRGLSDEQEGSSTAACSTEASPK